MRQYKEYEIRYIDGHDLKYKTCRVHAENENLAMRNFWDVKCRNFEHRIESVVEIERVVEFLGDRKINDADTRIVYTLNTWTDKEKTEARKYLEDGLWVGFGSTCIGHTLATMVENDGFEWASEGYSGILQIAQKEGTSRRYCRLK